MTIQPLSGHERAATGFSHVITVGFDDVNDTAGLSSVVAIFPKTGTFDADLMVDKCAVRLTAGFSGTGITSCTVQIGDGADPNRFLDTTQIMEAHASIVRTKASKLTTFPHAYEAADTIDVTTITAGANTTLLDAGSVEVYINLVPLANMTNQVTDS